MVSGGCMSFLVLVSTQKYICNWKKLFVFEVIGLLNTHLQRDNLYIFKVREIGKCVKVNDIGVTSYLVLLTFVMLNFGKTLLHALLLFLGTQNFYFLGKC